MLSGATGAMKKRIRWMQLAGVLFVAPTLQYCSLDDNASKHRCITDADCTQGRSCVEGTCGGVAAGRGGAGGAPESNGGGGADAGKEGGGAGSGVGGDSVNAGRSGRDFGGEGGDGGISAAGGASGRSATGGTAGSGGKGTTAGTGGTEVGDGGDGGTGGDAGSAGTGGGSDPLLCDQFFDQYHFLSEIEAAINAASAGTVICLAGFWDGSLAIHNPAATALDPIVVCGSYGGGNCEDSSEATIDAAGGGISLDAESDGFVISVDLHCTSDCESAIGLDLGGASHIRFSGQVDRFMRGIQCDPLLTEAPCDDIEIQGRLQQNGVGVYGSFSNAALLAHISDSGYGVPAGHHIHLTSGPSSVPNENILIEGNFGQIGSGIPPDSDPLGRSGITLAGQNRNVVIRNSHFTVQGNKAVIDCTSDDSVVDEWCDGVEVYNNYFDVTCGADCPVAVNLESTERARIYNNVFFRNGGPQFVMKNGDIGAADGWFFNNTVFCLGACSTAVTLEGTGHRVFNNLFFYDNQIGVGGAGLNLIADGDAACDRLGSSGEHFSNNFVYSVDGDPILPACGTGNSMTFNVLPGFVSSSNYHIIGGSAVAGFGTDEGAPDVDYDGVVRPSPPSAGAYDVP
jgi:hypothetical protein